MNVLVTKNKIKLAFTLAELLIVIGIVGIIAESTIPTLISDFQKQLTVVQLQKTFSVISQAYQNAQIEMGSSLNWSPPAADWDYAAAKTWWNTYFTPYANFSVAKSCTNVNRYECWPSDAKYLNNTSLAATDNLYFILSDGSIIRLDAGDSTRGFIYVDINGFKKPNIVGRDIFLIVIYFKAGYVDFFSKTTSRSYLLTGAGGQSCSKPAGNGLTCGMLIHLDGWKIESEYPWN